MASELQVPTFHTEASRWSHAVFMPVAARPVSRHPPSFLPDQQLEPGFGDVPTLSTLHQRFTCVRLTSAHLTGSSRLFRNAHHPGRWTSAACGGLDPGPATRVRGAIPHLLCSKVLRVSSATASVPPLRTVVAHSCRRGAPSRAGASSSCRSRRGRRPNRLPWRPSLSPDRPSPRSRSTRSRTGVRSVRFRSRRAG